MRAPSPPRRALTPTKVRSAKWTFAGLCTRCRVEKDTRNYDTSCVVRYYECDHSAAAAPCVFGILEICFPPQITDDNWSDGSLEPDNDDEDVDFADDLADAADGSSSPKRQKIS